jgi:predicted CopG family antitoxin
MVRKSSGSKAKRPIDRTMPNIRIMSHVKDELFEIAEKGETYSEVIQRLIDHYKTTKDRKK